MSSFVTSTIVTVTVSEAKVEYLFHKDVLVKSCPFFAKCLAANMKETLSNVVEMPDDSCGAFNLLAMYLYNEQIPDLKRGIEVRENNEAWTLADKLRMPGFQDLLMNKLMQYCGQFFIHPVWLSWALDECLSDTLLFKFMRDQLLREIASGREDLFGGQLEEALNSLLRTDFVDARVLLDLVAVVKGPSPVPSRQGCKYHVDGKEETCAVLR